MSRRDKKFRHVTVQLPNELYDVLLECARQAYDRANLANVSRFVEAVMNDVAEDYLADKAGEEKAAAETKAA